MALVFRAAPGRLALAGLALATLLGGCAALAPTPAPAPEFSSYVVLGENGRAVARVLIDAPACPPLQIDQRTHTVRFKGSDVSLTPKEYDLLLCLASDPGAVCSRDQLLRDVARRGAKHIGHDQGRAITVLGQGDAGRRQRLRRGGVGLHVQGQHILSAIRKHMQRTLPQGMGQRGVRDEQDAGGGHGDDFQVPLSARRQANQSADSTVVPPKQARATWKRAATLHCSAAPRSINQPKPHCMRKTPAKINRL